MQSQTLSIQAYSTDLSVIKQENPAMVPFLNAFNSKLIRDCTDREIMDTLNDVIAKSIFEGGYNSKDIQDTVSIIQSLLPDCKMFWKTLTLDELKLAANRGIRGQYGEIIGVSVASLSKMFNGYMLDSKRHEAKKALHQTMTVETKPEISEEHLALNRNKIILNAFDKYKSTGMYDDLGNYVYDCLKKAGIIKYTGKEVREFIVQAIDNMKNKKLLYLSDCTDLAEGRKVKRDLELLKQDEIVVSPEIQIEAKRLMLFARFNEMIFEEESLADLLV